MCLWQEKWGTQPTNFGTKLHLGQFDCDNAAEMAARIFASPQLMLTPGLISDICCICQNNTPEDISFAFEKNHFNAKLVQKAKIIS